jgi:3-oxoacyl-[acyl-carrier protein] reductase
VTAFKSVLDTRVKEFDDIIETNLRGSFLLTRAFLPRFLLRRGGMILNVISHAAKQVYKGSGAYAASKAGTEALMNVLRAEVRDAGVRVVNVFPGAVLTRIWHPRHRKTYADRMMHPSEIAGVLYGLTIQPPSMMTEEIIIRPQGGDLKV